MEMRTSKRSYWIQPMLVVGAILVAIGVSNAVPQSSAGSGTFVITVGDSYVALGSVSSGDSSSIGVLLPVNHQVGTNQFGRAETQAIIAGKLEHPRILSGSINSSGVHSGTVRNSSDTTGVTTFSITLAGSDTGTGTASSSHVLGETRVQGVTVSVAVSFDSPSAASGTAGSQDIGGQRDANGASIRDSGILSISAATAATRGLINNANTADTTLAVLVGNNAGMTDSRAFFLVYNTVKDTFITSAAGNVSPNTAVTAGFTHYTNRIRVETGINRVFVAWLGNNSDSVGELKRPFYQSGVDSIGFYSAVVIISDTTSSTGGVSGVNNGTPNDITTTTGSVTASSDTVGMTLTGLIGSDYTLVATPVAATAQVVVQADSITSNETHLSTPIFDFAIFSGTGSQVTQIAPGVLRLTMRTTDTVSVVNNGFRLISPNISTNVWENYTGLNGVLVTPVGGGGTLATSNAVILTVDVSSLPGDLVAVGALSGSSTPGGGDGGTCVLDKTLGGSIFAGSFGAIRSVRDLALSTGAGRSIVALYYAIGAFLAIGLFGFVAKKVRA